MPVGDGARGGGIEPERQHAALAMLAHQLPAPPHQPQAVGKPEAAGRHQCRVLAEAVPGRQRRQQWPAHQFVEYPQAGHLMGEQRRLGIARQADLAGRVLEGQAGHVEAEGLAGLGIGLAGDAELRAEVAAHPAVLRALPREHEHDAPLGHGTTSVMTGRRE
jgi:hypothetical protein